MSSADHLSPPPRPDFETAWVAVEKWVFHDCLRKLEDPLLAEDVTQNIALRAWRSYGRLRDAAKFRAWVKGITSNEVNRALARRWRQFRREVPLMELVDENVLAYTAANDNGPESTLEHRFLEALPAAVTAGMVSRREAEVLACWTSVDAPTPAKVGKKLGLTAGNCSVLRSRGWQHLVTFVFAYRQELVGGHKALAKALSKAHAHGTSLTSLETTVFQNMVLNQKLSYQPKGWLSGLRSACAKIAPHLKLAFG